jgi:hypothetical protein
MSTLPLPRSFARFLVQGTGLRASAGTQGSYIIVGPDPSAPLYTSVLCADATNPSWDEVFLEAGAGELTEDT